MKWLRQQNRVEMLSAAAEQNAEQMNQLRAHLGQQVRACLQQTGTLAWAFSAGILYGSVKGQKLTGQSQNDHTAVTPLRYLNSIATILNLMGQFRPDQQQG